MTSLDAERQPRRPSQFGLPSLTPTSPTRHADLTSSSPGTGSPAAASTVSDDSGEPFGRSRSIVNLTSSTLFGIYQRDREDTPLGTGGATTPIGEPGRHGSIDYSRFNIPDAFPRGADGKLRVIPEDSIKPHQPAPRRGFRGHVLPLIARIVSLFTVGVLYGTLVSHLRDSEQLAQVKVDLKVDSTSYLIFWGVAGVLLGQALPWADTLLAPHIAATPQPSITSTSASSTSSKLQQQQPSPNTASPVRNSGAWNNVVRSIGAFVGIAFAIRRLPWQSTLQLSLTLALANPAVWYAIDRSPAGFLLSTIVSLSGTAILLLVDSSFIPSPLQLHGGASQHARNAHAATRGNATYAHATAGGLHDPAQDLVFGLFPQESVVVTTWIASVLFVSALCFGNVGRRWAATPSTVKA